MKERVVQFGPDKSLFGIETLAEGNVADSDRPTWIVLNAGVVYRVGPHRMNVTLARRIARSGFHVLRFDLSGLGDTPSRGGGVHEEIANQDVKLEDLRSCIACRPDVCWATEAMRPYHSRVSAIEIAFSER